MIVFLIIMQFIMKKNIGLIISSVVALLPMVLAVILYDKLPEKLPMHYAINGTIDGYANKGVIAFGIPILMCVLNVFIHITMNKQDKKESGSISGIIKWLFPLISVIIIPIVLFNALK